MARIISHEDHVAEGLEALGRLDPRLVPAIERVGTVPLRLGRADFAGLAGIIVSQQVSKASADAIFARLSAALDPLDAPTLLAADDETLRLAGLSGGKRRTLRAIAEAVAEGRLDLSGLCALPAEEAVAAMVPIHGIGPWTAEIYMLFCAGHADIFPAGDLALQEGARGILGLEARPDIRALRAIAATWSPWRSVAARLLWSWYGLERRGAGLADATAQAAAKPPAKPLAAAKSPVRPAAKPSVTATRPARPRAKP